VYRSTVAIRPTAACNGELSRPGSLSAAANMRAICSGSTITGRVQGRRRAMPSVLGTKNCGWERVRYRQNRRTASSSLRRLFACSDWRLAAAAPALVQPSVQVRGILLCQIASQLPEHALNALVLSSERSVVTQVGIHLPSKGRRPRLQAAHATPPIGSAWPGTVSATSRRASTCSRR
jgi:hypothetical protein